MSLLAVIDVETTGINAYRHNRIVEIAAVVIAPDGSTLREFVTLVNPERDIGPSSIHGLCSKDLLEAPRFDEVAGAIVEVLDNCVAIGGHNIRFDRSFLDYEFQRIGFPLPEVPTVCSMSLSGGGDLCSCCEVFGVGLPESPHSALDDARAAARLLAVLLRDSNEQIARLASLAPVKWPQMPTAIFRPVTREESRRLKTEPPAYLQKLLSRLQQNLPPVTDDSVVLAYTALLDRVLEDRIIDEQEGEGLIELATIWGLTQEQVREAHRDYALRLSAAALSDGVVTAAERSDLLLVAALLGIELREFESTLEEATEKLASLSKRRVTPPPATANDLQGKRVCFTGEFQCKVGGEPITRDIACELARQKGLLIADNVTKKLDVLVVADPHTQSGKAKKARQYGIRILHEPVFWKAIGICVG